MGRKKPIVIAVIRCEGNVLDGKRVKVLSRTASGMKRCELIDGSKCYSVGDVVLISPGELEVLP
jgi:hypothetical protein